MTVRVKARDDFDVMLPWFIRPLFLGHLPLMNLGRIASLGESLQDKVVPMACGTPQVLRIEEMSWDDLLFRSFHGALPVVG